jgi:ADP-ribose pyrophosphatase YjhB (NUDIX family)
VRTAVVLPAQHRNDTEVDFSDGVCHDTRMTKAARAIIIENGNILVMHRNKQGSEYFTLVGGKVDDNETIEQGLVREIQEETGLQIVSARLVFYEPHPEPYNVQYIFLCQVAPHSEVAIQKTSEEALLNKLGFDTHTPYWIPLKAFDRLAFRTPQLHKAIIDSIMRGFPSQPVRL